MYNLPFDNYMGAIEYLPDTGKILFEEAELQIIFTPGHSLAAPEKTPTHPILHDPE